MDNNPRLRVTREHVAAALPYVQATLPDATYADIRDALIGGLPGIDAHRWHAWNRADYQRQLDQVSPRELARIAVEVLVNLTDLHVLEPDARDAIAEAHRILGLRSLGQ